MLVAAQDLRFGDVGGNDFRQGQKLSFQRGNGVRFQQRLAPEVATITGSTTICFAPYCRSFSAITRISSLRADHTDLDSIRVDIGKHGIQLLR